MNIRSQSRLRAQSRVQNRRERRFLAVPPPSHLSRSATAFGGRLHTALPPSLAPPPVLYAPSMTPPSPRRIYLLSTKKTGGAQRTTETLSTISGPSLSSVSLSYKCPTNYITFKIGKTLVGLHPKMFNHCRVRIGQVLYRVHIGKAKGVIDIEPVEYFRTPCTPSVILLWLPTDPETATIETRNGYLQLGNGCDAVGKPYPILTINHTVFDARIADKQLPCGVPAGCMVYERRYKPCNG